VTIMMISEKQNKKIFQKTEIFLDASGKSVPWRREGHCLHHRPLTDVPLSGTPVAGIEYLRLGAVSKLRGPIAGCADRLAMVFALC
jgi:hypothetical protein